MQRLKAWLSIMAAVVVAAVVSYGLYLYYAQQRLAESHRCRVLIVYNQAHRPGAESVMAAYQSVMTEEGIPWEAAEIFRLIQTPAAAMARQVPALICPDALLQEVPDEALGWVEAYLAHGGNLAVIYDAGAKAPNGDFREQALFSQMVGVNYLPYGRYKEATYTTGRVEFGSDADAAFFQIPPGKIHDDAFLKGYIYGDLKYPLVRAQLLDTTSAEHVFAHGVTAQGEAYPAVVLRPYGQGKVLYVNLPLGYLKAYADDLPLRSFLRTFLFQIVQLPHLVSTENGTGKLVINWHIDANAEWPEVAQAIAQGFLDNRLPASIHITAGDFRDTPGDQLGFDACGRGRAYAWQYLPFGVIGSHGGWAHNWFADQLEHQRLSADEIRTYLQKNKTCLESITNYPLREYSAPSGVHPQPVVTQILESMGFNAYYYTGDCGSAPNRTFSDGKMVSSKVFAFPVMVNGKTASLYEMQTAGLAPAQVGQWLTDIVDYVVTQRTPRLFYSHLVDSRYYPQALQHFLQYAARQQSLGKLDIQTMSAVAAFSTRFVQTRMEIRNQEKNLSIRLKNEEGLKGITVAVPRGIYRMDATPGIHQSEDDHYYYLTVDKNEKEKFILAHGV